MNNYYQSFIDKFSQVRSKEELTRTFEMCCGGLKDEKGNKIVCGCNKQAFCCPEKCQVYREYMMWMNIIDVVRKPTVVYVKGKEPKKPNVIREYKISPKTQCKRTVESIITKMKKVETNEMLDKIKEHIEGERFKRAYNLAVKSGYDNITRVIEKIL